VVALPELVAEFDTPLRRGRAADDDGVADEV
jgi:hypothetical protein